jgi:N-succinyldiaminopimelate aminotransferase
VAFTSLSKRSNVPGLRSGFVAGDAADQGLLAVPHLPRQRHGPDGAAASIAAWNDEAHVVANRALYRAKFAQVCRCWRRCWTWRCPTPRSTSGPVYRRPGRRPADEVAWAQGLLAQYNVNVLPGSLLARGAGHDPANPGAGRIRMALVALWPNAWKPRSASSPTPKAFTA